MTERRSRVGVVVRRPTLDESLVFARNADAAGIDTGWLTIGPSSFDSLTFIAAAASQTSQIRYGTSILPAFTQHPVNMVAQVRAIEAIAPNRLRLGIGVSHGSIMGSLGIPLDHPLDRLREYLQVLRPLLHQGAVDFAGDYYQVTLVGDPLPTPVLVSALRENAYRQAGELSDGAISWVSPLPYLVQRMKPAMVAAAANRPVPPLIAHVSIAVGIDRTAARVLGQAQLGYYPMLPFYRAMFIDSGWAFAEGETAIPEDLLDHLVISGTDDEIVATLRHWLDSGVDELLVNPLIGPDTGTRYDDRTLAILAAV